jgi:hypothetical protein
MTEQVDPRSRLSALLLAVATVADVALAVFLVAISGFIFEGVNNTGPMMPDAIIFAVLLASCVAAPVVAWLVRRRASTGIALLIAIAPLAAAAIALASGPA